MSDPFLHQRHAAYHTPIETIAATIKSATGHSLLHALPIIRGYANEVYSVQTDGLGDLIVRINHHNSMSLYSEVWALAQCQTIGVPVPHVYDVATITIANQPREVMVMEKLPGLPLTELQPQLTQEAFAEVIAHVGAALSALHCIPVQGFGLINGAGQGQFRSWQDYVQTTLHERRLDLPVLIQAGLGVAEAERLFEIVSVLASLAPTQAVLCHGDLSTEHIFIDTELQVRGLIDFGQCQGGMPALDLAILLMYHPEIELDWLERGYQDKRRFDAMLRRQILVHQANILISYLAHDTREGNTDARDIALQGIRAVLRDWQTI